MIGNRIRTGKLMAGTMALFGVVVAMLGGGVGMLFSLGAHELAHVNHRYILTSTTTASIAGAVSTLAIFRLFSGDRDGAGRNPAAAIVVKLVAPIAAMLIQFAISRSREYEADRGGAVMSGDPRAPADAPAKIERYARDLPLGAAESQPATARMMIVSPLSGGGLRGLLRTHPSTEERVRRLLALVAAA